MPVVTVLGAASSTVTVPFTTSQNVALAQQLASAITAANQANSDLAYQDTHPPLPAGKFGEFVQTQNGLNVLPTGYRDVVNVSANAIIFGSGDADERILSGTGNLTFFAAAGSGSLASGGGNNSIYIGAGDTGSWDIATDVSHGHGELDRGRDIATDVDHGHRELDRGRDIATDVGHNQIIDLGTGPSSISAGGGNNLVRLGSGQYTVSSVGNDTVVASTGAETVGVSGAFSDVVLGYSSNLFFINGTGASTVLGGTGSDTVFAGAGGGLYKGGSAGNNMLDGGFGAATLWGGGNNDVLFAGGSDPQALYAGPGSETLFGAGASGADTFFGGVGGSGGTTDITMGLGNDTAAFIHGNAGTNLVNEFDLFGTDKINLQGYAPGEKANALATQTVGPGGTTLHFTDGTTVTFAALGRLITGSDFT